MSLPHASPDPDQPEPADPADLVEEEGEGEAGIPPDQREFDLLVVGDLHAEVLVVDADAVVASTPGETLVSSIRMTIGGSAAIMAAGAARLGLRTAFCGVIGEDELGASMLASMAEHGVDVRASRVDGAIATGATIVRTQGADRVILRATGTTDRLQVDDIPVGLLATSRHVHVGSAAIQADLRAELPDLFLLARALDVTTSFDVGRDPGEGWEGAPALLAAVDVCFCTLVEASRWTGLAEPEAAARALADGALGPRDPDAGPLTVVVRLGREGALAVREGRVARAAAPRVQVVDTTGAGDSLAAGFVAAMVSGWPLEESLRLAVACGTASVRGLGGVDAQATLEEAEALLRA